MSCKLYEKCSLCGVFGLNCVGCKGSGFVEIGLTQGQVERMAKMETAGARAWLGDSGIDGNDRYTVRHPDRTTTTHADLKDAIMALAETWEPDFRRACNAKNYDGKDMHECHVFGCDLIADTMILEVTLARDFFCREHARELFPKEVTELESVHES